MKNRLIRHVIGIVVFAAAFSGAGPGTAAPPLIGPRVDPMHLPPLAGALENRSLVDVPDPIYLLYPTGPDPDDLMIDLLIQEMEIYPLELVLPVFHFLPEFYFLEFEPHVDFDILELHVLEMEPPVVLDIPELDVLEVEPLLVPDGPDLLILVMDPRADRNDERSGQVSAVDAADGPTTWR